MAPGPKVFLRSKDIPGSRLEHLCPSFHFSRKHDIESKELSRDKTKINAEGRQMTFFTIVVLYPHLSVFYNDQVVEC